MKFDFNKTCFFKKDLTNTYENQYLCPATASSTASRRNSSYIFRLKLSRRKNDQKRYSVFISAVPNPQCLRCFRHDMRHFVYTCTEIM